MSPADCPGVRTREHSIAGQFCIEYVDLSDEEVRERLRLHTPYSHAQFCFVYCQSAEEAYQIERELFHELRPPENLPSTDAPAWLRVALPNLRLPRASEFTDWFKGTPPHTGLRVGVVRALHET